MTVWVALMRSMVIKGRRIRSDEIVPMAERAGGTEVRSVIATGNLVFRSRKGAASLVRDLEAECAKIYGQATEIVVKSAAEWRALLDANPFPDEAGRAPSRLLVWAMRDPLPDSGLEQLRRRASGAERVERVKSGDFYCWFGAGDISASRLTAGFGLKALGAVGTNRNWNSAQKILAAVEALDA